VLYNRSQKHEDPQSFYEADLKLAKQIDAVNQLELKSCSCCYQLFRSIAYNKATVQTVKQYLLSRTVYGYVYAATVFNVSVYLLKVVERG
jgi:hypothetical protein